MNCQNCSKKNVCQVWSHLFYTFLPTFKFITESEARLMVDVCEAIATNCKHYEKKE